MRIRSFVYVMVAAAAQNQEFDLLIRGGHVIDPRNNINAVVDVAIEPSVFLGVEASRR